MQTRSCHSSVQTHLTPRSQRPCLAEKALVIWPRMVKPLTPCPFPGAVAALASAGCLNQVRASGPLSQVFTWITVFPPSTISLHLSSLMRLPWPPYSFMLHLPPFLPSILHPFYPALLLLHYHNLLTTLSLQIDYSDFLLSYLPTRMYVFQWCGL